MRLIDADSLKELYEEFGEYEDNLVVPIKVILQNIDDMPTAYDIDEKVGKLEELIEENVGYLRATPEANDYIKAIRDAIKIVRAEIKELKPCPFCGGKAEIEMDDSWYWNYHVLCQECKIGTDCYETADEAIEAWNRRADEQE